MGGGEQMGFLSYPDVMFGAVRFRVWGCTMARAARVRLERVEKERREKREEEEEEERGDIFISRRGRMLMQLPTHVKVGWMGLTL